VVFAAAGKLTNHGTIIGGADSGPSVIGGPGHGGDGVDLASGSVLSNIGVITGGDGGHNGTDSRLAINGYGGVGVSAVDSRLANRGTITGGLSGGGNQPGGIGIVLQGGELRNTGTIAGGAAGYNYNGYNGIGGIGIVASAAATITNTVGGTITGGAGGIGMVLGAGTMLVNHGMVTGGSGADNPNAYNGGPGGIGVELSGGTIINTGHIGGGNGEDGGLSYGYRGYTGGGGTGLEINNGNLFNSGVISGGFQGATGIVFTGGGTIINTGSVYGSSGTYGFVAGGNGGLGVKQTGGTFTNDGTIAGAVGGGSNESDNGYSGAGMSLYGQAVLINHGTISGGAGGPSDGYAAPGGAGVTLTDSTLTNSGTITGGIGGSSAGSGAPAGVGVMLTASTLTNSGMITGGNSAGRFNGAAGVDVAGDSRLTNSGLITGGMGYIFDGGGAGVSVNAGDLVRNAGTIVGGAGGTFAEGGAGISMLGGGTLVTSGTIAGGLSGKTEDGQKIPNGDAVQFGTLASTLVIAPTAVFVGQVAANATVNDVLRLTGQNGTLTGLGTQFTNFTTLAERPNADWTISGVATLATGGEVIIRQNAALTLDGALIGPTTIRLDAGATLTADAGLTATTIRFANGGNETLALNSTDPVTGTLSGFRLTDTIDIASTITTLSAMGGKIILLDHQTAVETLTLDGNFTASQFALTPDDHGGTDITLIAATSTVSPITSPSALASVSLRHDGLMPLALFAMHPHAL
jgi:hypothetical protein